MSDVKIPWPKKLRNNQVAIIERSDNPQGRKKWRASDGPYEAGSEHDAHGVCTLLQKRATQGVQYRIAVYQRIG